MVVVCIDILLHPADICHLKNLLGNTATLLECLEPWSSETANHMQVTHITFTLNLKIMIRLKLIPYILLPFNGLFSKLISANLFIQIRPCTEAAVEKKFIQEF